MGLSFSKCKLITRNRVLLDCMAHSVIVPSIDGQLGIMRGHSPLVCELALGIMSAKKVRDSEGNQMADQYFLIGGGFVNVVENSITVLAYDVMVFEGIAMEDVDKMVEQADKLLEADAYARQTRGKDIKKADLIKQLARMIKTNGS